ncbi:MAG: hypothetical protein QXP66_00840 [Candidatus Aenigmatarchaeota archaeon]
MAEYNKQIWQPTTPLASVPMNEKAFIEYENGIIRYKTFTSFYSSVAKSYTFAAFINADIIVNGTVIKDFTYLFPSFESNTYIVVTLPTPGGPIFINRSLLRRRDGCALYCNRILPASGSGTAERVYNIKMPELGEHRKTFDDFDIYEFSASGYISGSSLIVDIISPDISHLTYDDVQVEIPKHVMKLPYTTLFDRTRIALAYVDGGFYPYPFVYFASTTDAEASGSIPTVGLDGVELNKIVDILPLPHCWITQNSVEQVRPWTLKKDDFFVVFTSGASNNFLTFRLLELTPSTASWYSFSMSGVFVQFDTIYDYGVVNSFFAEQIGRIGSVEHNVPRMMFIYRSPLNAGQLNLFWSSIATGNSTFRTQGEIYFTNTYVQQITSVNMPKKTFLPFFAATYQGFSGTQSRLAIAWAIRDTFNTFISGTYLLHSGVNYQIYGTQTTIEGDILTLAYVSGNLEKKIKLFRYNIYTANLDIYDVYDFTYTSQILTDNVNAVLGIEPDLKTPYGFIQSGSFIYPFGKFLNFNLSNVLAGFPDDAKLTYTEPVADGYFLKFVSGNSSFIKVISHKFLTITSSVYPRSNCIGFYPAANGYIIATDKTQWYAIRVFKSSEISTPTLNVATPLIIKKHSGNIFEVEINK